ncbi:NAD(P)H-binding protein [Paraburkholderia sp. CNPSo 3076]|uniref:NmrA family NAD(P)-binding protein n=1 Tax=Paraburkholderia sp. CNPSo 3076 TaxID=2940936 RepID=UPI00224E6815|nr:NAD(P)H-binding protein [Paraburkholderia sp. CNPSo 3076]MCX5545276.1 NAD(P)H-binding protein [Paraburkholderia sp. CNPSo 3076]
MFVIFGASGKAGRVTAAALRRAGKPVRAVVRHARQGESLAELGCEIVLADLTDALSVAAAIEGAHAVQLLCPVPSGDTDPETTMRTMIDVATDALRENPPATLLAISDYGAELPLNTGITRLYHYLEKQLKPIATQLVLLRSAEHMQNWAAFIPGALATGTLPSLHLPLERRFPTVAAQDVGTASAALLLESHQSGMPRIVSIEGPHRVSVNDIAAALSAASGRTITPHVLPRESWAPMLLKAGLSEKHGRLITDLYDVYNTGRIDVEASRSERRFGTTALSDVFGPLVAKFNSQ